MIRRRARLLEVTAILLLLGLFAYIEGIVLRDLLIGLQGLRRELTMLRVVGVAVGSAVVAILAFRVRAFAARHRGAAYGAGGLAVIGLFFGHIAWHGGVPYLLALAPPPPDLIGNALLAFVKVLAAVAFGAPAWGGTYAILAGRVKRVRLIAAGFVGLLVWSRAAAKFFELTEPFDPATLVGVGVAVVTLAELAALSAESRRVLTFYETDATGAAPDGAASFAALVDRQALFIVVTAALLAAGSMGFLSFARAGGGDVARLPAALEPTTTGVAVALLAVLLVPIAVLAVLGARSERRPKPEAAPSEAEGGAAA